MLIIGRLWRDFGRPPAPGWLRIGGTTIEAVGDGPPPPAAADEPVVEAPAAVIVPGFTDAHLHLPQFGQRGIDAADLLRWLDEAIFPAEARWADPVHAEAEALACLRSLIRAGTLRAATFLTAHAHGAAAVARAHASCPVDLLAGVSLMDRAAPPDLLQPAGCPPVPPADLESDRLRWSINPRFAIACTPELLAAAARLAAAGDATGTPRYVHTHLAEQPGEVRRTAELFPEAAHTTGVYDDAGLVRRRTLLAHAIHLSPEEWAVVAARRATVVHCPGANTFLGSGLFDLAAARRHGVPVALGSDIAAGPDIAMPRVARAMIEVARIRRFTLDPDAVVPTAADAWTMITAGNAAAVGRPGDGRLEPGASADLLLLEPDQTLDARTAGRLLHAWDDGWITARLLAGRFVDPN